MPLQLVRTATVLVRLLQLRVAGQLAVPDAPECRPGAEIAGVDGLRCGSAPTNRKGGPQGFFWCECAVAAATAAAAAAHAAATAAAAAAAAHVAAAAAKKIGGAHSS